VIVTFDLIVRQCWNRLSCVDQCPGVEVRCFILVLDLKAWGWFSSQAKIQSAVDSSPVSVSFCTYRVKIGN
jgi:hypothetical protein